MSYTRLLKLKDELGVMTILWKRYEYGIEDVMEDYRRHDHIDEIATIKIP
jgi:predicted transcriptional regulator